VIRFRHLFGVGRELDRQHLAQVQDLFRRAFPYAPAYADQIARWLDKPPPDVEPVLLVAVGPSGTVTGFTWVLTFPDLRCAYLDYIASDPDRPARGIGGALYEATRELLQQKGVRGLFLDVPHDDPARLKDPSRAPLNRRRLDFYARYGALPIVGTLYDRTPTPANEGWMTHLVYDPLGHRGLLRPARARRIVRAIYARKYGLSTKDPLIARVVASFRDDPIALRAPRRVRPEAAAQAPRRRLVPVRVVLSERHRLHHLKERGYVERPVRIDAVLKGLDGLAVEITKPRHFGETPIRAVHKAALLGYLARASARLSQKALIYPTVFPLRRRRRPPRAFEMRAGYYCIDTFTPLAHNSYVAARAAVDCALTGALLIEAGERFVYALCRPPGHHAEPDAWGGFCYFNNAAVAAHRLSRHGRVAVLDIDHHHGNGTQEIFYRRADVLTVSIHGHPDHAYPYFTGFADERGADAGKGFNRNFPLFPGADDALYLKTLDEALRHITRFRPAHLVVSLGYDIMKGDPTGTFVVSATGMRRIGERIGALRLPTLLVQEGGYSLGNLRAGSRAFVTGLSGTW